MSLDLSIRNITVFVTEKCNFSCSYCFQRERKNPKSMNWDTGKKLLDWYINTASENEKVLSFTFFGGEPLLEFQLIKQMVKYGNAKAEKAGKKIEFGATTNGSLFNQEVAAFWKENNMSLLLSVDGGEQSQNLQRISNNGKKSSELIEKNIPYILEAVPDCTVRMTVTQENQKHIVENLNYLYDKGFRSLAHYPVEAGWDDESLANLDKAYRAAANWYLKKLSLGEKVFMGLYSLIGRRLIEWNAMSDNEKQEVKAPCGAGKGYLGVSVDGKLFPCHRFVSLNDFKGRFLLGDIESGFNTKLRNQFVRITNKSSLGCHTSCQYCEARSICLGGCLVQNLMTSGDMLIPMPAQQFISTMYYETVKDIIELLESRNKKLLQKFLGNNVFESSEKGRESNIVMEPC